MSGRFLNIFSRNTKLKRKVSHAKKSHYFLENTQKSLFKRRRKNLFTPHILRFFPPVLSNARFFAIPGIILLLLFSVLFLSFSPFFKISDIYIFRQDSIINIDQAYENIDYIRGKNILFLDTNEIALKLQKSQKSISSIEFDIDFPRHINIHIGSYPALFQTEKYLILSNGVVIPKDSKQYIGIPFLKISKNIEDYAIFGNTLNVENLRNLNTLIKESKKNILGFDFQQMKYYITEKELILMHISGGIFIFDLNNDIQSQIEKLAIYEKEKGSIYEKKYVYIDLRVPGKLFLCSLQAEYDCRRNIKHIYGDTIFEELATDSSGLPQ